MLPFLCALLFVFRAVEAQEFARLPYVMIYKMEETETNLSQTFTNLYMFLRMSPTTPGVQISDVKVFIDNKDVHIPVPLNPTNGNFFVPMRDNLLPGETWVVANQPRGTMNFQWYMGLKGVKEPTNGIRYRDLMRPVEDMVRIHHEMAKIPGIPPMAIPGLRMLFPTNLDATVVIRAQDGDKPLKSDAKHTIFVSLDPVLLTENPEVNIPVSPDTVLVTEPDGDN